MKCDNCTLTTKGTIINKTLRFITVQIGMKIQTRSSYIIARNAGSPSGRNMQTPRIKGVKRWITICEHRRKRKKTWRCYMAAQNKAVPYRPGEPVNEGEVVFTGADGNLYKMNPLLMTKPKAEFKEPKARVKDKTVLKEPGRPVLFMPKGTLKEVKKGKKQSKMISTAEGTFLTEKTLKARQDRQALLQGQGKGSDDWMMGDDGNDEKKKALLSQRPQVVVNGGFDPKIINKKAKAQKADDDDEI